MTAGADNGEGIALRAVWTARMAADAVRQRHLAFRSPDVVRAAQERRVRRIVAHAHRHVPYYRETMRRMLLGPEDIRDADALARLPLLEREQLQRDPEYFVSERWTADRCVRLSSGGSTGAPITIFRDPASFLAEAAHYERLRGVIRKLAGRHSFREAVVMPPESSTGRTHRALHARTLLPKPLQLELRTFPLVAPGELIEALADYRPDVIGAYGSFLEALFVHLRAHRPPFPPPRVAVFGADPLSPSVRAWAENALGVRILGNYGAIEAPHIGFECERGHGYHLNVDLHPIRLLGIGADGDTGEVVVSNLVNRGTVVLNYRLGDRATRIDAPCECGRRLPLLAHLERTKLAWFDLGGGTTVHVQPLRYVLHVERDVWRFQIVQVARRELLVRLIVRPGSDEREIEERVLARLRRHLPSDSVVRVAFVSELPLGDAGKVQPAVVLAG